MPIEVEINIVSVASRVSITKLQIKLIKDIAISEPSSSILIDASLATSA